MVFKIKILKKMKIRNPILFIFYFLKFQSFQVETFRYFEIKKIFEIEKNY